MKNIRKRTVLRLFLVGEIMVFTWMYLFSTQGMQAVFELHRENQRIEQDIKHAQEEIAACEHELYVWQSHSFYKEKLAREQLQMARPDEKVYYLT